MFEGKRQVVHVTILTLIVLMVITLKVFKVTPSLPVQVALDHTPNSTFANITVDTPLICRLAMAKAFERTPATITTETTSMNMAKVRLLSDDDYSSYFCQVIGNEVRWRSGFSAWSNEPKVTYAIYRNQYIRIETESPDGKVNETRYPFSNIVKLPH